MTRLHTVLITGAAVLATALVFTACGNDGDGEDVTVVTSLETTGITVSGHGEVDAEPDVAYVDLGVVVRAPTVAAAREQAAVAATSLIDSVKASGVPEAEIQTRNLSIYPAYEYPDGQPRLVGYEVTNTVVAKVTDMAVVGTLIDDALAAAGDNAILQSIRFDREDIETFSAEAREEAIADARDKAEQLAALNGVEVGAPIAITEGTAGQPEVLYSDASFASLQGANDSGTPIQPGTGAVVVDLQVRFAIER